METKEILNLILKIPLKDWFIAIAFIMLVFCLFEIQRLKRIIAHDSRKNLSPQLMIELIVDGDEEMGLYLKNEGFFIAQNIKIETPQLMISDFGFATRFYLEFEGIEVLRPQERKKLQFEVFDRDRQLLQGVNEKILPHLINPSFKVTIYYANIEGIKFCAVLFKKRKVFYSERIDLLQENSKTSKNP